MDGGADGRAIGAKRRKLFDIRAIALAAMPVSDKAKPPFRRKVRDRFSKDTLGDRDFRFAIDLSPHGARGVEHENSVIFCARDSRQNSEGGC